MAIIPQAPTSLNFRVFAREFPLSKLNLLKARTRDLQWARVSSVAPANPSTLYLADRPYSQPVGGIGGLEYDRAQIDPVRYVNYYVTDLSYDPRARRAHGVVSYGDAVSIIGRDTIRAALTPEARIGWFRAESRGTALSDLISTHSSATATWYYRANAITNPAAGATVTLSPVIVAGSPNVTAATYELPASGLYKFAKHPYESDQGGGEWTVLFGAESVRVYNGGALVREITPEPGKGWPLIPYTFNYGTTPVSSVPSQVAVVPCCTIGMGQAEPVLVWTPRIGTVIVAHEGALFELEEDLIINSDYLGPIAVMESEIDFRPDESHDIIVERAGIDSSEPVTVRNHSGFVTESAGGGRSVTVTARADVIPDSLYTAHRVFAVGGGRTYRMSGISQAGDDVEIDLEF